MTNAAERAVRRNTVVVGGIRFVRSAIEARSQHSTVTADRVKARVRVTGSAMADPLRVADRVDRVLAMNEVLDVHGSGTRSPRAGRVRIVMTLTSPMCPVAEILPVEIESRAREIEGVRDVTIDLVWDPPWHPDMMSEAARLELGM